MKCTRKSSQWDGDMEKLTKDNPEFYRIIAGMRKVKSGGKYFKDVEKAREAQKKGAKVRREQAKLRKAIQDDTATA